MKAHIKTNANVNNKKKYSLESIKIVTVIQTPATDIKKKLILTKTKKM